MVGNKEKRLPAKNFKWRENRVKFLGARLDLHSPVPGLSLFPAPYIAAEPGWAKISPYIWGGRKGEFRNWTRISTDPTATLTLNYTEKVNKMRNILSCWEYRRLTLIGKI